MEIILKQDVQGIGKAGSIVKVKDGYAHNFLLPRGLGMPANQPNLKILDQQKDKRAAEQEKQRKEALVLKDKIAALSLTIPAQAQEDEKIYGSITAGDIERLLKDEGLNIDKNSIIMEEPIKSLGVFEIPVKLHPEVTAKIKVWIVKK